VWRQATFYPFSLTARYAKGEVLRAEVTSPTHATDAYGEVPLVDLTATRDPDTGETTVFAVNRSQTEPVLLEVATAAMGPLRFQEGFCVGDPDPRAANTQDDPDRVTPRPLGGSVEDGVLRIELPPVSWSCARLASS
jgi:alpha-N-arabinofuranosidase